MSNKEAASWSQYFAQCPWGAAEAMQAWATFSSSPNAGRSRINVIDFMPRQPKEPTSVQEFRDNLKAYSDARMARRG